jgi:hypothetical protein
MSVISVPARRITFKCLIRVLDPVRPGLESCGAERMSLKHESLNPGANERSRELSCGQMQVRRAAAAFAMVPTSDKRRRLGSREINLTK